MDELTVEVECSSREQDSSATVRDVAHHIKSRVGVTAAVVLKEPGQVPRSQGKAVRVRDLFTHTAGLDVRLNGTRIRMQNST